VVNEGLSPLRLLVDEPQDHVAVALAGRRIGVTLPGAARRSAIMCAEALWWRCHRRIIADYLIAAGETVFHILSLA